jgi:hypothetical protein
MNHFQFQPTPLDIADNAFADAMTKLVGTPQDLVVDAWQHNRHDAEIAVNYLSIYTTGQLPEDTRSVRMVIDDVETYVDMGSDPDEEVSSVTWIDYINDWRSNQ